MSSKQPPRVQFNFAPDPEDIQEPEVQEDINEETGEENQGTTGGLWPRGIHHRRQSVRPDNTGKQTAKRRLKAALVSGYGYA